MTRVITAGPTSPRMAAMHEALNAGDSNVLDAFWRNVEAEGTPLIEPASGDDAHYLVTFLYREEGSTGERLGHVVVCSHAVGWSFLRNRMERLAGTDLWYRCAAIRPPIDGFIVLNLLLFMSRLR
jgi:hypothetical protein